MSSWIQFGILLLAIFLAAMRVERRISIMETKVESMWDVFIAKVKTPHG